MSHINPQDPRLGDSPAVKRKQVAKYRPVLTASQILHILTLCKTESPISSESMSVIATLSSFQAKIENAGITPAYIQAAPKPKANSLEALGFVGASSVETVDTTLAPTYEDKEAYWSHCYAKYSTNPASCTLQEIHAAKEHMYINDLMSEEEVRVFESDSIDMTNTGE